MRSLGRNSDEHDLLRRLASVRPGSAARWGRMSPHQMVCHLGDSFRMALGQKAVSPVAGVLNRTVVKWVALYAPLPWPAGIPTRPEIDQEREGTRPSEFAADVAELQALLCRFGRERRSVAGTSHPVFGRMSEAAWLRWAWRHMDHHLRQFGA